MKKPKDKIVKCGKKTLCKTISGFMQDRDAKGIVFWDFVNLSSLVTTRRLIGYKEDKKAKGLLFNFCPWCGGKLGESGNEEKAKVKKLSRYEKIMARPDGKRPLFVKELANKFGVNLNGKDFVMSINVLHQSGAQSSMKWTEKQADEAAAREKSR